jgi:hypothetical protein
LPNGLLADRFAALPVRLARFLGLFGGGAIHAELVVRVATAFALALAAGRKRGSGDGQNKGSDGKAHAIGFLLYSKSSEK